MLLALEAGQVFGWTSVACLSTRIALDSKDYKDDCGFISFDPGYYLGESMERHREGLETR